MSADSAAAASLIQAQASARLQKDSAATLLQTQVLKQASSSNDGRPTAAAGSPRAALTRQGRCALDNPRQQRTRVATLVNELSAYPVPDSVAADLSAITTLCDAMSDAFAANIAPPLLDGVTTVLQRMLAVVTEFHSVYRASTRATSSSNVSLEDSSSTLRRSRQQRTPARCLSRLNCLVPDLRSARMKIQGASAAAAADGPASELIADGRARQLWLRSFGSPAVSSVSGTEFVSKMASHFDHPTFSEILLIRIATSASPASDQSKDQGEERDRIGDIAEKVAYLDGVISDLTEQRWNNFNTLRCTTTSLQKLDEAHLNVAAVEDQLKIAQEERTAAIDALKQATSVTAEEYGKLTARNGWADGGDVPKSKAIRHRLDVHNRANDESERRDAAATRAAAAKAVKTAEKNKAAFEAFYLKQQEEAAAAPRAQMERFFAVRAKGVSRYCNSTAASTCK